MRLFYWTAVLVLVYKHRGINLLSEEFWLCSHTKWYAFLQATIEIFDLDVWSVKTVVKVLCKSDVFESFSAISAPCLRAMEHVRVWIQLDNHMQGSFGHKKEHVAKFHHIQHGAEVLIYLGQQRNKTCFCEVAYTLWLCTSTGVQNFQPLT